MDELNQQASKQLNAPLVIMDGFEITLQKLMDFNDEEIESINILKDASATAIYGSRGEMCIRDRSFVAQYRRCIGNFPFLLL